MSNEFKPGDAVEVSDDGVLWLSAEYEGRNETYPTIPHHAKPKFSLKSYWPYCRHPKKAEQFEFGQRVPA